jgi:hypothetical protein
MQISDANYECLNTIYVLCVSVPLWLILREH